MVIAEVSIVPIGTKTSSLSKYVAKAIEPLKKQTSISFNLTAMGTILEGELSDVMTAVSRMHENVFDEEINRVVTNIRIDDRHDKNTSGNYKIQSVMHRL
ncbi:MAG: MTH1187 family thiamine-binding protein [Dehalococcoidia bacterium]|nr:MAG: MTH1187 family thiamine-binding protein [Dehalococcoidia bacterium]